MIELDNELTKKRGQNITNRKKQATADHNAESLLEMANREKFVTKSGIKVERNRTIDTVDDSPERDVTLSPKPDLRNIKDDVEAGYNSDTLAMKLN